MNLAGLLAGGFGYRGFAPKLPRVRGNKYKPHQGEQEKARRVKQFKKDMERGGG